MTDNNTINDIEFKIAKLDINSNDILCVKIPRDISNSKVDNLRSFLKKVLPKNTKVILTDMDMDFTILTNKMHDNIDDVSVQNKG